MKPLVYTLFFLSGAAGLVYQVVWARIMTEIFGSTVLAVGTVLAAFMSGLALGSWGLGRSGDRSRNPLRLYAAYEIGIGLAALASTALMVRTAPLYVRLHQALEGWSAVAAGARFGIAFGLVLIPTLLMGATLPVLSRWLIGQLSQVGRGLSSLYAVNTAGAVTGSLAAGFLLIGRLGVQTTIHVAVAVNLAVGLAAWLASLGRGQAASSAVPRGVESEAGAPPAAIDPAAWRRLLVALALSGFTSFAYEIYWTRALVHLLGNSTYAFTLMLVAFLAGIALGGWGVRLVVDRARDRTRWFAWLEIAIGVASAAALPLLFGILRSPLFQRMIGDTSARLGVLILSHLSVSLLVMLVPATLIGATFPLVGRIYVQDLRRTGAQVGKVYAVNTVGNVAGALAPAAGLLMLLGIQKGIVLMALLNVTIGAYLLAARAGRRTAARWAVATVGIAAVALLIRAPLPFRFPSHYQTPEQRVLYYREGLAGTTKVLLDPATGEKQMTIDGVLIGGTGLTDYKQQVLAHLTKLLVPGYASELTVGLGSGILGGESARHPALERIVSVEIEPTVVEGAAYFTEENHGVLSDPRGEIVVDDAGDFLRTRDERFDIISADEKTADTYASNGFSYSLDYYELLRRRLAPGGVVIQWVPNDLPSSQYRMVIATFARAFPHVTLWYFPPVGKVAVTSTFLTGSAQPLEIDPVRMNELLRDDEAAFRGWRKYGIDRAEAILAHFVAEDDALRRATREAPINTLEHPRYEFYSPREYAVPVNRRVLENHELLISLRRTEGLARLARRLAGGNSIEVGRAYAAEDRFLEGFGSLLEERSHAEIAERFDAALRLAPWNDNLRGQIQSYYWNRAGVLYLAGDYPGALALLRRAAQLYPANGEVRYYLGLALLQNGAIAAALEEMRQAVRLQPRLLVARHRLVELEERILGPDHPRLAASLEELSAGLRAIGAEEEAAAAAERALRIRVALSAGAS